MGLKKGCYYASSHDYHDALEQDRKIIEVLKRAKREILLSGAAIGERNEIHDKPNPMEIINEIEDLLKELIY
jgi:hypothetical protein